MMIMEYLLQPSTGRYSLFGRLLVIDCCIQTVDLESEDGMFNCVGWNSSLISAVCKLQIGTFV
jgi:hypothetical protein